MSRRDDTDPADGPSEGRSEVAGAAGGRGDPPADGSAAPTPLTQQLGRIATVAVLVVFVVFALDNAQHVDFSWLVGSTEVETVGGERVAGGVRLIVLLAAAFAAGAVTAGTAVAARARARRRAARR